ncbi:ATPase [Xaviernesmea oryzae]|uniref:P-type Zn(2+) transporter n=1 Tax=Xaviernesmea oryzae TaxID=464029 RepID=A0A1Q9AYX3_9HYPH|nr:heavy metal translocating P-type ATPase [Xaviernesmea oryzae]OLP60901.1 ATPase [Xaviernesmea oryzae]SEL22349.1 Cd2+/Zn2+-exporting ATPase [Xaviernesmea oryzae]
MSEQRQTRFRVEGMDCASCAAKIDTAVRRHSGVADVAVSVTSGTMTIHHGDTTDLPAIESQVTRLGYKTVRLAAPTARAQAGSVIVEDTPSGAGCCAGHAHDHAGHKHGEHDHDGHDQPSHDHAGHDHHDHSHSHSHDTAAPAVSGLHGHDHGPTNGPWWASAKGRLTIFSGLALAAAYGIGHLVPSIASYAFLLAMAVGLVPIARRAVLAAFAGTPFSIEMLMTIAAIGAIVINATEEAAAVVFLFLVGELLEGVAAGRARASIQSLTTLVPKKALRLANGKTEEVPAESLEIGTLILVRPGERISADGVIVEGQSAVDEASVTGESVPVSKGVDDTVFAGTVNGDAALTVRVTAAAADNTIARVVRLVEEAQESKAPTERFIDRFSRYYTPGVVALAALVALIPPLAFGGAWGEWVYKALAILLIGCPCALVISTPAAIAASLSAGARRGLLLKGGAVLEQAGKLQLVALDKTGTLTRGKPDVTDILAFDRDEREVLRLAGALETGSSHPLALAILARAEKDGIALPSAQSAHALGGKGVAARVEGRDVYLGSPRSAGEKTTVPAAVSAQISALNDEGKTVSLLVVDGQLAGGIAMRDEPREDAAAGLKALSDLGIRTVMLTGDNARTANAIGRTLGIDVRAELMPEDKQRIVGDFKREGLVVGKVGDGINDAPALAAADLGMAMGGGTDVALETADAAILHGRVGDVARMVQLSRRTMRNIGENITIALGLKAVFLVTTLIGITGLWPAILADTGATVLVTMNALRLLRVPD